MFRWILSNLKLQSFLKRLFTLLLACRAAKICKLYLLKLLLLANAKLQKVLHFYNTLKGKDYKIYCTLNYFWTCNRFYHKIFILLLASKHLEKHKNPLSLQSSRFNKNAEICKTDASAGLPLGRNDRDKS